MQEDVKKVLLIALFAIFIISISIASDRPEMIFGGVVITAVVAAYLALAIKKSKDKKNVVFVGVCQDVEQTKMPPFLRGHIEYRFLCRYKNSPDLDFEHTVFVRRMPTNKLRIGATYEIVFSAPKNGGLYGEMIGISRLL